MLFEKKKLAGIQTFIWTGCAVAVATVLLILYTSQGSPTVLDQFVAESAASLEGATWTSVWKAVAFFGDSSMIVVQTIVFTFIAAAILGIRRALWIPLGVALAYAVNILLKIWMARPRPEAAWGIEVSGYSFPSANAMLAVALYGLFVVGIAGFHRFGFKIKSGFVCLSILLIFLVGCSRLYFQVHYATDILAGYAMGSLVLISFIIIQRIIQKR